jgi:hypothetical protein
MHAPPLISPQHAIQRHHDYSAKSAQWASDYSDEADDEGTALRTQCPLTLHARMCGCVGVAGSESGDLTKDFHSARKREPGEFGRYSKRPALQDDGHTGLSPRFQSLLGSALEDKGVFFLDREDAVETFCADTLDVEAHLRTDGVVAIRNALISRIDRAARDNHLSCTAGPAVAFKQQAQGVSAKVENRVFHMTNGVRASYSAFVARVVTFVRSCNETDLAGLFDESSSGGWMLALA